MSGWLIVERGPGIGDSYHLRQAVLTIGRSPVNLVQINDKSVSRRHAQLRLTEDQYFVTDLKSSNGTFINGKRLSEATLLEHDDLLQLGEVVLRYKEKTILGKLQDRVMERKDASKAARFHETMMHEIDDDLLK
ncbi:FHA domain-containing protein [bacterium]|nr:FHA domain-containing protein [candidate division CSSED10-310 bacterium]